MRQEGNIAVKSSGLGQIPELDGIRGIACLMVLVFHYALIAHHPAPGSLVNEVVTALEMFTIGGVDLFFVLSGFLIGGILIDKKGSSNFFVAFWTRRAARILPLYFLVVGVFVLVIKLQLPAYLPWMNLWLTIDPLPLWSYATFTQNFVAAFRGNGGAIAVVITWSLAVEEQFYLLFPLVVVLLSRRQLVFTVICCIFISIILRTLAWWHINWYASYVLLPCRMDTLMCGVLVACIVRNERALAVARRYRALLDVCIVILAVLVAGQLGDKTFLSLFGDRKADAPLFVPLRYTWLALLFGLFILRIFLVEQGPMRRFLSSPLLTRTGLISYGIYMYHEAANGLLHGAILGREPRFDTWPEIAVTCLAAVLTFAVAAISFIAFERPIRRLGHRVKYQERRTPESARFAPESVSAT